MPFFIAQFLGAFNDNVFFEAAASDPTWANLDSVAVLGQLSSQAIPQVQVPPAALNSQDQLESGH